jgi:DNA-binding IclR family transcriptional regulator
MLEYVPRFRAYRLGVPVLSMAHAMSEGSSVLKIATPLMTEVAMRYKINVGLAVADEGDMVYLESFRYSRRQSLRTIVRGLRIPMALTSLGRAYLATLPAECLDRTMSEMASRHPGRAWLAIRKEIKLAIQSVREKGYCIASWQPQVVAVATPMRLEGYGTYILNASVSTQQEIAEVAAALAKPLLALAAAIQDEVSRID